jgi:uncharacterized protein (UPF0147 family)
MSAVGGSHRNIRKELEEFRSGIKKLNDTGKLSVTINGRTYSAEITKSRWFKIPEVIVRDLNGREVIRCKIKDFGESKLRHAVLKDQWREKKGFSMEQRAQLYVAAESHGVGHSDAKVSLTPLIERCLKTAKDSNKSITQRADALLGLCAMYNSSTQVKQNMGVANFFTGYGYEKNPVQEIANGLLDVVKDPSLSTAEREKAGELLAKMYNDPEVPRNVKDEIHKKAQEIANGLLDAVKDLSLSTKEREEAGELLAKMYNDPGVPRNVKDEIHKKAQAIVADLGVIALRARLGVSEEVARKIISEHGPVSGATLQRQIITPNPKAGPTEPKNIMVIRSYNNVDEQVAAIEAKKDTHNISRHTIEVDGQTLNFWIAKDKAGVSPSSLYLEDPKASRGSDSELRDIINDYKNSDISGQKEKLDRLLSMAEQNGFSDPKALEDSLSIGKSFPFQGLGFGPTNGGRISGEAAGCLPSLKDLREELQKTIKAVVKEHLVNPDSNTLSEAERSNIVKAWSIATGEQKTFDEIVDQFKS